MQRPDNDEATRKILQMPVDGMRNRGRPNLGWRDLMKEDMSIKQMTTEMAKCRKHWHFVIQGGTLRCLYAERLDVNGSLGERSRQRTSIDPLTAAVIVRDEVDEFRSPLLQLLFP